MSAKTSSGTANQSRLMRSSCAPSARANVPRGRSFTNRSSFSKPATGASPRNESASEAFAPARDNNRRWSSTMKRVVLFSVTSLCLALVAVAGLAAYTAAHPPHMGALVDSGAIEKSQLRPMSADLRPSSRTGGCAENRKLTPRSVGAAWNTSGWSISVSSRANRWSSSAGSWSSPRRRAAGGLPNSVSAAALLPCRPAAALKPARTRRDHFKHPRLVRFTERSRENVREDFFRQHDGASSKCHSYIILTSRRCPNLAAALATTPTSALPGGFMRAWVCAFALIAFALPSIAHCDEELHHVLLLSIDGLHAQDVERYVRLNPSSALAQLTNMGLTYTNAATSKPSDSFPGLLSMVTGGSPRATGVFYDDSYDRTLSAPGSNCSVKGTEIVYDESIDFDSTKLDAGGGIDPTKLPLDGSKGCTPVFPHSFLRVNTIFEVARNAGLYTAWSDKHPA